MPAGITGLGSNARARLSGWRRGFRGTDRLEAWVAKNAGGASSGGALAFYLHATKGFRAVMAMGYAATADAFGVGGAVTQITTHSTGVTLNTLTGRVTMVSAAQATVVTTTFALTNSKVEAGDLVLCWVISGEATPGSYIVTSSEATAGAVNINVFNATAGTLTEAPVIGFAVFKAGATA